MSRELSPVTPSKQTSKRVDAAKGAYAPNAPKLSPAQMVARELARQELETRAHTASLPGHGKPMPPSIPPQPPPPPPPLEYSGIQRDEELVNHIIADNTNTNTNTTVSADAMTGTPNTPSALDPFIWDFRSESAMRLMVDGQLSLTEIAKQIGVPALVVNNWRSHPDFQRRLYAFVSAVAEEEYGHPLATRTGRARAAIKLITDLERIQEERAMSADAAVYNDMTQYQGQSQNENSGSGFGTDSQVPFAFDAELATAPGGRTGLVQKRYKVLGTGPNAEIIPEFSTDTALVQTIIAAQQHAARELGQFVEKAETTINRKLYIGVDIDRM